MKILIMIILIVLILSVLGCSDMPVILPPIYTERQNINPVTPAQAVKSDKVTSNKEKKISQPTLTSPSAPDGATEGKPTQSPTPTPSPSPTNYDDSNNGGN